MELEPYSDTLVKPQFRKRMFNLDADEPTLFLVSQWSSSRTLYCVYRGLVASYVLIWLFYSWIGDAVRGDYPVYANLYFLTNLGEILLNIYFVYAFFVALAGKFNKMGDHFDAKMRTSLKILWILQTASYFVEIYICIAYWALLSSTPVLDVAINIHKHLIVGILVIIDTLVVANEFRYLHAIYAIPFGAAYIIYSLILHWAGVISNIYDDVLDWEEYVLFSSLLSLGSTLVLPWVLQGLIFGLYALRRFIYLKLKRRRRISARPIPAEGGVYYINYDNQAYQD